MRLAYALLGLAFLVLIGGTLYFIRPKEIVRTPVSLPSNHTTMLTLTSPVFVEGGSIPAKYTCDGTNTNPELHIEGVPEGAKSLALIMDDPDIPDFVKKSMGIEVFDHWVLYNVPADTKNIPENTVPGGGVVGKNGGGKNTYTGPCPPDREHRYFWKLYALDSVLELGEGATKAEVERAMEGHVLATSTLIARYARP